MRKNVINVEQEEQNTQDFMEKLLKFKKQSKIIKQKSAETSHKVEWTKQLQHYRKQE